MNETGIGSTTVMAVGIILRDIEAKVRARSDRFGLPDPEIRLTNPVDEPADGILISTVQPNRGLSWNFSN